MIKMWLGLISKAQAQKCAWICHVVLPNKACLRRCQLCTAPYLAHILYLIFSMAASIEAQISQGCSSQEAVPCSDIRLAVVVII
jgi:hypothetical protein